MKTNNLTVLSLFDGMSCGRIALEKVGIKPAKYYASEIDKYAEKVSAANYPDIIRLGDVTKWESWDIDWSQIDIVTGGFPCQAWSMAGKQLGDRDERGMLFWVMLDVMKKAQTHNPNVKFLIENVKMKKEFEQYITLHTEKALGDIHKTLINSALVSAQNRNRYYWTNFPVTQPEDKGLILADIIENNPEKITVMTDKFCKRNAHMLRDDLSGKAKNLSAMEYVKNGRQGDYIKCGAIRGRYDETGKVKQQLELRKDDKTNTLTTVQKDNQVVFRVNDNDRVKAISENARGFRPHKNDPAKSGISELGRILKPSADKTDTLITSHMPKVAINHDISDLKYRKLTPIECERLQTVPDGFTDHVSNTQRYKMLGNGWTVDVIAHIFKCMFKADNET